MKGADTNSNICGDAGAVGKRRLGSSETVENFRVVSDRLSLRRRRRV